MLYLLGRRDLNPQLPKETVLQTAEHPIVQLPNFAEEVGVQPKAIRLNLFSRQLHQLDASSSIETENGIKPLLYMFCGHTPISILRTRSIAEKRSRDLQSLMRSNSLANCAYPSRFFLHACGRRDLNSHGNHFPMDFKSIVATNYTTPAFLYRRGESNPHENHFSPVPKTGVAISYTTSANKKSLLNFKRLFLRILLVFTQYTTPRHSVMNNSTINRGNIGLCFVS